MVHVFFISAALMTAMLVEIGYAVFSSGAKDRKRVNRRMAAGENDGVSQKDILIQLRKERGMDQDGNLILPMKWLNTLFVQAGFTVGLKKAGLYYAIYLVVTIIALIYFTQSITGILIGTPIFAFLFPVLWLRRRRSKKMRAFADQLPEAVDLITRSLKAGHPVPVAISSVAREMPDPIGTEFGLVSDEITYGSDLVTALISLYERVGHDDLPLLVSAVSIQSTTGGNLREILEGLSTVIRDRQKMKRKVHAISAEGRMSAIFLSALPVILFIVLLLLMPDYYMGIWHMTTTWIAFGGLGFWLVMGNILIFRMVSFKV
ncbi:MAG: type II secretion system protein F [Hyphomicrobiales bacterium]|nr:MAG: type II secretion system protein F [Hyphomicrobiales bacterium]